MRIFERMFDFSKMLKMTPDNPGRVAFEKAVKAYWLAAHGVSLIEGAGDVRLDITTATIEELRTLAESCVYESHRLEAMTGQKVVYAVRRGPHAPLLFADKSEKEARTWSILNQGASPKLFKETIAKDGEGFRVLHRDYMGDPVEDSKKSRG